MCRLVLILATLVLAATSGLARAGDTVLVFAAASTRDAMEDAITAFAHSELKGVYAASPALARQILDGAPASLFLSANTAWMDAVDKAGLLTGRSDFLRNRLVLVAPANAPSAKPITAASEIEIALGNGRLAMAETRSVPAGLYGRQALTRLKVWDTLSGRIAEASNARTALLLVERGETPLGIVYATDARVSKSVSVAWQFPETAHDPIVYPLARVKSAKTDPGTEAFHAFLLSPAGRDIFRRHGFETD
jgi:molybdate transport system substrate-binding protein